MRIYDKSIGEMNPDGTVKTEAEVCALTGVSLRGQHEVKQMLGATDYFVRVVSPQYPKLTEDVQAELLASVAPKSSGKKAADAAKEG